MDLRKDQVMAYIIIKQKGTTVLVWKDVEANWSFFMGGMSDDVHWQNVQRSYIFPKKFKDFGEAKWYLDMRAKRLKPNLKKADKEWAFHIIREEDLDVYLDEVKRTAETDALG